MNTASAKRQDIVSEKNVFAGQSKRPTETALALALGSSLPLWNQLIAEIKQDLGIDTTEWHSGSVKHGWSMRLQFNKRNIVYLGPRQGWFVAAFALGDKAVVIARRSTLPPEVIQIIKDSRRYAEGTAVQIAVKSPKDLEIIKAVAKIKIES